MIETNLSTCTHEPKDKEMVTRINEGQVTIKMCSKCRDEIIKKSQSPRSFSIGTFPKKN